MFFFLSLHTFFLSINYSHGTPNFNPILSCTNCYLILTDCSNGDNDLPNNRFFTSSLAKNKTSINKTPPIIYKKAKNDMIMILGCSGVIGPSKHTAFHATFHVHKTNIVLRCESKLCNSMCTYEFFHKNYTIFCKDVHGGGVFVATSDRIIFYEIPDLDTDCKMIMADLHFSDSKPL